MATPNRAALFLGAGLLAACASTPQAVAPAPAPVQAAAPAAPAADLSGAWDFTVIVNGGTTTGEMTLQRGDGGYTGSITPEGQGTLPVRSLTVAGQALEMTVETPEGPVVFNGTLSADQRTMDGIVHYHGGQDLPLTARKR